MFQTGGRMGGRGPKIHRGLRSQRVRSLLAAGSARVGTPGGCISGWWGGVSSRDSHLQGQAGEGHPSAPRLICKEFCASGDLIANPNSFQLLTAPPRLPLLTQPHRQKAFHPEPLALPLRPYCSSPHFLTFPTLLSNHHPSPPRLKLMHSDYTYQIYCVS